MTYAGFWIRFLAELIDITLSQVAATVIEYLISAPFHLSPYAEQIIGVVPTLIIIYLYYVEIPMRRGTTIGKSIFGIYVVDNKTGEIFSRKQATIRMLSYLLSYAIIGLGFLMVAFHPQKLALHDLFAGTLSIRRKKRGPEEIAEPAAPSDTTVLTSVTE